MSAFWRRRRAGGRAGVRPRVETLREYDISSMRKRAKKLGRDAGKHARNGYPFYRDESNLSGFPGRREMASESDDRLRLIPKAVQKAVEQAKEDERDAGERLEDAEVSVQRVRRELTRETRVLDELPEERGLSRALYGLILVVLGVFEYPTLVATFDFLPLDDLPAGCLRSASALSCH